MADCLINAVAKAVVASLNGGTFTQTFTAERKYLPLHDLPDMATLHVTVVPSAQEITAGTRASNFNDVSIDIAVQIKPADTEPLTIDPFTDLVEEIHEHFRLTPLEGFTVAHWLRASNVPLFSLEHLREMRQFTSVLTITWKVQR